jgi:hypothetical protein
MNEPTETELVVGVDGGVKCIYDESLDLRALGKLQITRASHVEPDLDGNWWADMGPVGGPVLGPYLSRSEALVAERGWLVPKAMMTRTVGKATHHVAHVRHPWNNCHIA